MIFNAFLDFFSLASFLPLLVFVINPEFLSTNTVGHKIYSSLDVSSINVFIMAIAASIFAFILIKNLISAWIANTKTRFAFGISNDLSSRALAHYLDRNYLDFTKSDFTRELNRITNYPLAFANNIILPIASLISEGFIVAFIMAGLAFYDYKVVVLLLLILLPILLYYRLMKKHLQEINHEMKEKYPLYLKYALQSIEGFTEIKASGKEPFFHNRFRSLSTAITKIFIKDQLIQSGTIRLTEIIVALILCFLIIYSVSTEQPYQETLLLLGIYTGASFRVIPSINRILHGTQQIRIHEHLLEELRALSSYRYQQLNPFSTGLGFQREILLKGVSFAYPGGVNIIDDVSLQIRKGEKVALVGKSGEGKTTLLLVLLRFLKETEGEMQVDGNPVTDNLAWRKVLGYVPQNPYILDGTIAENIAFGIPVDEIDRTKISQLIDELDLREMIIQMAHGIDTKIGERGAKLSGGQRQRIAIARALYANTDVFLLDEITNQVHTFLELEILNILEKLALQKKTIIMVTHKLTRTDFFDSIYNLENGKLHPVAVPS